MNCNKPQSYASIFSLDGTLKEVIFSKDGFISVYLGCILKNKGIEFEVGEYSEKYENDFIISRSILIECKMFKSENDLVAIRSEMDSCFSQIKKHIKQLDLEGIEIKQAYLLWNRNDNAEELQIKLRSKYNLLFKKYELKIICPDEIEKTIEEMK